MKERYSLEEVWNLIGEEKLNKQTCPTGGRNREDIEVDGFIVRSLSLRYMTFYQKGTKCVCCGKEGTHFKLTGEGERKHFNLYAEDGTLFTKDHIFPKSRGGVDCVSNLQTMCVDCNKAKGNRLEGQQLCIVATNLHSGKEKIYTSIDYAVADIITRYPNKKLSHIVKNTIDTYKKINLAIDEGVEWDNKTWRMEWRSFEFNRKRS